MKLFLCTYCHSNYNFVKRIYIVLSIEEYELSTKSIFHCSYNQFQLKFRNYNCLTGINLLNWNFNWNYNWNFIPVIINFSRSLENTTGIIIKYEIKSKLKIFSSVIFLCKLILFYIISYVSII